MPTVTPGSKILVTGANGFIPVWVIQKLLEKGYSVRGTVRSASKGTYLEDYFKSYGSKLELVVVPDIVKDGAFDESVKDVDAILHLASPFTDKVDDPKDFIEPAIHGTVGVLDSALKFGNKVQRVIITSSCVSIAWPPTAPTPFSETDWNDTSIAETERQGKDAETFTKYQASKTLAEKAAWEWYGKHKKDLKWDVAVLNPPYVFGPAIHDVTGPLTLNLSVKVWYFNVVSPDFPKTKEGMATSGAWVDVRDLADAHVLALEKAEVAGERTIVASGLFYWQEWLDVANKVDSGRDLPKGVPGDDYVHHFLFDLSKGRRIFSEIKHRTMEETAKDMLDDFAKRGY